MRLSIITVCYNQPHIKETCESIAAQTWRGFEWIVVDGESTDGTMDTIRQYEPIIDVLISEKDSGVYNAMNKGIRHAKGEYILFLNGGDSLLSRYALEQVFSGDFDGGDVVYGDCVEVPLNGRPRVRTYTNAEIDENYFLSSNGFLPHQAAFIKRALFEQFGLYNEKRRIAADWEKWIEFSQKGCRFKKINSIVSCFRMDGLSSTSQTRHIVLEEMENILAERFPENKLKARAFLQARESSPGTEKINDNKYKPFSTIFLLGFTVIKILRTIDARKTKYYCFGIPAIKKQRDGDGGTSWLLFCCLRIFRKHTIEYEQCLEFISLK